MRVVFMSLLFLVLGLQGQADVTILATVMAPDGTDYKCRLTDGSLHVYHWRLRTNPPGGAQAFVNNAEAAEIAGHTVYQITQEDGQTDTSGTGGQTVTRSLAFLGSLTAGQRTALVVAYPIMGQISDALADIWPQLSADQKGRLLSRPILRVFMALVGRWGAQ